MEKVQNAGSLSLKKLPSLPQILVRLLEAVSDDSVSLRELAEIVRRDTATTARLLEIANTGYYRRQQACESIEDALRLLGMETVKTLVITAAIQQYFQHLDQQHHALLQRFWLRSLIAAHTAHALASLTRYHSPPEAYLAALMVDAGQLCLLTERPQQYAEVMQTNADNDQQLLRQESETLETTHCDVGAAMLEQWRLDNFMSEAVRYHHEPAEAIANGHHLVKIINLASELSQLAKPGEQALNKAHRLFGLNEELTLELRARIGRDVRVIADQMGIQPDNSGDLNAAQAQLGESLEQITRLDALTHNMESRSPAGVDRSDELARCLYLGLGIDRPVLFIENPDKNRLDGYRKLTAGAVPEFQIELNLEQSVVVQCLRQQKKTQRTADSGNNLAPVADQQLLHYCQQDALICLPFNSGDTRGVLLAGADQNLLTEHERKQSYFRALMSRLAPLLCQSIAEPEQPDRTEAIAGIADSRLRETLHEVSNPLSIINNYLDMLRLKLDDDKETLQDLDILREEIDRVGQLLMRLRSPAEENDRATVNINELTRDLATLMDKSMCRTRNIQLQLHLDPDMPRQQLDAAALKQVLGNLVKNAIEAMPEGGKLTLSTNARFNINGRSYREIVVQDDGPGIPDDILARLFEETRSHKGPGHGGLGLKIVRQLVDRMGGQIHCSSDSSGTRFGVLLAADTDEPRETT